ncbi:hypothetical protein SEA_JUSTBECAUSE_155 [Streptomyces phage JustBecause]|nr:hypothetical protein SEA_JUSTBECAUSE_155 [Streptomyces phage JustBecause]
MTTDVLKKHKVNHVALVIDKSGSMSRHESTVIRVVDEFVKGLKEESDALGHETRISLYAFDHNVECLVWDMDVKALPSMRGVYRVVNGATSLIEASVLSLEDLKSEVSEKYGEHSFLQVVWTDGEENASGYREYGNMHTQYGRVVNRSQLDHWLRKIQSVMGGLPEHWTSAILVPSSLAKRTAQSYGFPAGNIAVWDADTTKGVEEAIGTVKAAATSFLRGRESGVRGTKNLFAVGQDIDISTVKAVLKPLSRGTYEIYDVETAEDGMEIRDFVEKHTEKPYRPRSAYYELGARVSVQFNKDVLVYDRKTRKVYGGDEARELLFGPDGRTNGTLSVKAGFNPDLKVFVMSGSYNRKLKKNTKLLVKL